MLCNFSFNCSCPNGMQLNSDSLTCEDIDECEIDSPCSHFCENIEKRFLICINFPFGKSVRSTFSSFLLFSVFSVVVLKGLNSTPTIELVVVPLASICQLMENHAKTLIHAPLRVVVAVRFATITITTSFVHVEMASRLMKMTKHNATM